MRANSIKKADTDYNIEEIISLRWSPRAFSDKTISNEDLRSIFEAARWAASSYNEQPWSFIVASKTDHPDAYEKLLSTLVEFNQSWAKTAPVLALSVARDTFERNGNTNHHSFHDVGLAVGNLLAEATARGIYVHPMAGFSAEKAIKAFNIPNSHTPVAAMALGYPGDPNQLPDNLAEQEQQPRKRKSLQEFLYTDKWNDTAYFLNE